VRIETGERLRRARLERGLELADAAAQLKVHPKYLRALEWERPDLLPSGEEAKEYLRAYAQLLGLGEVPAEDERAGAPLEEHPPEQERTHRRLAAAGLIAGAALSALGLAAAWQLSREEPEDARRAGGPAGRETAPFADSGPLLPKPPPTPEASRPRRSKEVARTRLVVAAVRGDSWVEARSGSARGRLLYRGNLVLGRSIRLSGPRVWVRFGAASNLDLTVNGRKSRRALFGTLDVTFGPPRP
jgi:transcriptional regulator with XRE-family HTH domain